MLRCICGMALVLCLVGLAQAQDVWAPFAGAQSPGNTTGVIDFDYSSNQINGTIAWTGLAGSYLNTVEGLGYTTSSGVGCGNVYKVGTTTVSTVAQLPESDRAPFKGFVCVNDPACNPQTLGPSPSSGTCSMTRFHKISWVAQGMQQLGPLYPIIPVGVGTWGPNVTAGNGDVCPTGKFVTNMRCWKTSNTGCLYRQIECSGFGNSMFRLDTLPLVGGATNNRGGSVPSADQGWRYVGSVIINGFDWSTNDDITPQLTTYQIKSCANGYKFDGSFNCVGKPCPAFSLPAHVNVSYSPPTTPIYPATAFFACDSGFTTSQSQTSQCQPDANGVMYWTYPAPTCTGVPCSPLTAPSNGGVTTTNFNQYPSNATYTCNVGYSPDFTSAACTTSGYWNPSTSATCIGVPCNNNTLYVATTGTVYPTVTNGQRYPSTATYSCQPGYTISSAQRTCQSDGSWAGVQPTCTGVSCPMQSPIANGVVSQPSAVYPTNATYTCNVGFQSVGGSAVRYCNTDGTFQGVAPACNAVPCVVPNATLPPLNVASNPAFTSSVYPSTITYSCLPGYYPSSALTFPCNTSGGYPLPSACLPRSINVTSRLINSNSTSILPATNAAANLTFSGSFGNTAPSKITFGPAANPLLYACTPILFSNASQSIRCTTSQGVGSNLTIWVTLSDPAGAVIAVDNFLSFVAPMPRNLTLRAAGNADVGQVKSTNPAGDSLAFLCDHCGTVASQITVTFKAPQPFGITCGSIATVTTSGDTQNVSCSIGASAGGPYPFYLTVGGVLQMSDDTYRYPDGPAISTVSGCVNSTANGGTANCPCSGGSVILTIRGSLLNYSLPVSVKVNQIVTPAITANASVVTVALPPGVGSSVGVQIICNNSQSQVAFLLSYGAPIISNVTGCVNTTQCQRTGADVVTLSGSNFGSGSPEPLVVLVGTYPCLNVVHDASFPDSRVTCTLSPGKGINLGIFAIQPNGLLASSPAGVTLSYDVCLPGTYDNQTGLDCIACAVGSFSSVSSQTACSLCEPGTYGPTQGLSACVPAGQGYFTDTSGAISPRPCAKGYFTTDTTAIACEFCLPGTYTSNNGSVACSPCSVGMASGLPAATACSACLPGTFSPQQGASVCANCLSGWAAPSPGAVGCTQCGAGSFSDRGLNCSSCQIGTYQNQEGSIACAPCDPGRYSNMTGAVACTACPQGKYQGSFNATSCLECPSGSSSSQYGVTACSPCIQGTQQNQTGQLTCNDCPAGKQALYPGAVVCDDCAAGKFASATRTVLCLDCLVSTATNMSGQSSCAQCDRGTYASALGLTVCMPCTAGKFASELGTFLCSSCPPGAVATGLGATVCVACAPGRFAVSGGQTKCEQCSAGLYSGYQGATACPQCPPGTFGNTTGSSTCPACAPGTFSASPASQGCDVCLPGKFSIGNADACTACSSRTIALSPGSVACTACPNDARANPQLTDCICDPGYLRVNAVSNGTDNLNCRACYRGANCSQAGTTSENVQTLPGWWRSSLTSTTYYRCLVAAFCAGGINSDCDGNRAGPLCVSCAPGYRSSRATSSCDLCPANEGDSWTYSVIIMIIVGVAAVFVYWAVLRLGENQAKQMKADKDHNKIQVLSSFRSSTRQSSRNLNISVEDTSDSVSSSIDEYAPNKKKKDEDLYSLASRRAPNFLYKIKIVIGFFQIANVISFQGDISWPQLYQSFITIFQVLNLDFVPWQSIGCATKFDFYWKAIITGLIPVAVFILLMLGFVVPSILLERREKYTDADAKRLRVRRLRAQLMKLILFTVFLLYPHVSSSVLGVFNCVEVEGVYYLMNDFSLICFDERWRSWALPCIAFVIAYPIGIPLAYFFILKHNKPRFQEVDTIVAFGFLYEAYQDDAWFFELLDMVHKLILTSLVPFLPNNMEMAANMLVIVIYLQIILSLQPYVRKGDDRLHQIVQAELCLLAMLGWTLGNLGTSNLDPTLDYLISILLIILTVFLLLAFVVMTLRNSFKLVQLVRRIRRRKNQQFQAERGGVLELCASTLKKKNHAGVWQERFFVLCEDGFLEWYSNKSKEAIVGIIPVSQILSVREDANPCRFGWDIKAETTVSFELQAKDAETCAKWVRSLGLLTAGNKVERMDPSLIGRYWRDTAAMRMLRLQRNTSQKFRGSSASSAEDL